MRIGIGAIPFTGITIGPNMPTPTPTPAPEYNPQTDSYTPTVDQSLELLPLQSSGSDTIATTVEQGVLTAGVATGASAPTAAALAAGTCTDFFDQYFNPNCGTPYGLYAAITVFGVALLMGMKRR
jgi:hypothetical protein